LALYIAIYKTLKEPFNNWADGVANKIRSTLEAARDRHSSVVQSRIDQVGQMKDSVDLTKAMFALSKVRLPIFLSLASVRRSR
jgi:F-type H+-transporting ATPase subunit b